jgi:hypothetical protein
MTATTAVVAAPPRFAPPPAPPPLPDPFDLGMPEPPGVVQLAFDEPDGHETTGSDRLPVAPRARVVRVPEVGAAPAAPAEPSAGAPVVASGSTAPGPPTPVRPTPASGSNSATPTDSGVVEVDFSEFADVFGRSVDALPAVAAPVPSPPPPAEGTGTPTSSATAGGNDDEQEHTAAGADPGAPAGGEAEADAHEAALDAARIDDDALALLDDAGNVAFPLRNATVAPLFTAFDAAGWAVIEPPRRTATGAPEPPTATAPPNGLSDRWRVVLPGDVIDFDTPTDGGTLPPATVPGAVARPRTLLVDSDGEGRADKGGR